MILSGMALSGLLMASEALPLNNTFETTENGKLKNWQVNTIYPGHVYVESSDGKRVLRFKVPNAKESHLYSNYVKVGENDRIISKMTASGKGALRVSLYCYTSETKWIKVIQSPRVNLNETPQPYEFVSIIKSPSDKKIGKIAVVFMGDPGLDAKIRDFSALIDKTE